MMCAILGYRNDSPDMEDLEALKRLWLESEVRGLHAFGFTAQIHGAAVTAKAADPLRALEVQWPFKAMIGHCRYSTSGDWMEARNNQPVVVDYTDTSLVFNGVISMAEPEAWELEFGFKPTIANDGEIAIQKILKTGLQGFEKWVAKGKFSFAGLVLHEGVMYAIRNAQRPMWCARAESGGVFIASTRDIFLRAGFKDPTSVEANKLWRL